ncbi:VirD4-like conjugal transfer protein, CD1115 family [Sulfobacillus harzensis]|uniref:Type IV secretory system conjugative DNA transfer family protein n=1 Tax=Sulfobacillus harzensis TaxID=2729629 RepID=A0A7Y0L6R7_9FIRM|nr:type IV secretory system conjugative DNA transfer family protein [Sulfobacillus harzensis]NMP24353.1 type IV secretory system conjugative DNA transfer family protein [Sulfobacillus harzensis]
MNDRAAKALVGGLFGAIPGWLIGMELADVVAGVIEPIGREMKAAKAAGHPGFPHIGPIWHTWKAQHGYLPTHWGSVLGHPHLVIGVLGLGALTGGFIAYQSAKSSSISTWGGPSSAGKGQYGTAHWRPSRSLRESYSRWQAPVTKEKKATLLKTVDDIKKEAQAIHEKWEKKARKKGPEPGLPKVGLLVGVDQLKNPLVAWILERDEHALVLGSTRSGKTRRLIIPSVGIIGSTAQESLVLTDPKGELFDHTAAWLESRGYNIVRIDLIRPRLGGTHRFNPIAAVWHALHDGPTPDYALAAKIARQVAHIITYGAGNLSSTEPIWVNGQISLTSAMILAVAERAQTVAECHLASAYRLMIEAGSDEGKTLDAFFEDFAMSHPAKLSYSTYQLAQGKTRASIITGAAAGLQLWGDPEIAWLTGEQDHALAQVGPGDRPTATFLVIPHDDASRYMAAALYVNQLFRSLTDLARDNAGRLPRRVNFLLDEFGNLPSFPDFDQFVTVSAGMGIRLVLALQNIEQLRKHYEATERTIRGNLGTWLFLRTSDLQTAKELSEMIGRYTLNSESLQLPKVGWNTIDTGVAHTSQGLSLTGRELVTADELMRWPKDQVLCWQAGYPPAQFPLPDLSAWQIFPDLQARAPWQAPGTPIPEVPIFTTPPGLVVESTAKKTSAPPARGVAQSVKGGDHVDIPVSELGNWGDLFLGQRAPLDPDDVPVEPWEDEESVPV